MFNKSLFNQSIKANRTMWSVITVAICFMLACVMLISGNGNVAETTAAVENEIIKGEVTSLFEKSSIGYYEVTNTLLETFDSDFKTNYITYYTQYKQAGLDDTAASTYASAQAYTIGATNLSTNIDKYLENNNIEKTSTSGQEILGVVMYTFNPLQEDGTYMFDSFYTSHNETPARYTSLLSNILTDSNTTARQKYVTTNTSIFLAANVTTSDFENTIIENLSSYNITKEVYESFGFMDYDKIKSISNTAQVYYKADLEYRIENIKDGETIDSIKAEIKGDITASLLDQLPSQVSDALQDIGQMDMYGLIVGSIFYKMAGLLLPIIYVIMASNNLVAGQVDSGSMAYILSTSAKRREVTFTQGLFMISSLLLMFTCTTITSLICFNFVNVTTDLTYTSLILLNLGAFLVMLLMSGICFFASCLFNRSKYSLGLGGGLTMFFLVATMLGLFGSSVLPSIVRLDALNCFNYVSVISLFDVVSILEGTNTFIWKFVILGVSSLIFYTIGSEIFARKDLPL